MPDSSVPCPEPMPYSSNSNEFAEIDFTPKAMSVFTNQPQFVEVDKVLSNQVGPITNPVQTQGYPVLPPISDSTASPLLSSTL